MFIQNINIKAPGDYKAKSGFVPEYGFIAKRISATG